MVLLRPASERFGTTPTWICTDFQPLTMMTAREIAREFGAGLLDLLFPPICLICGELAEPFCAGCRAAIRPVGGGGRLPAGLEDARSAGWHDGPLREAVLKLKLGRKVALAAPLAELLGAELAGAVDWR